MSLSVDTPQRLVEWFFYSHPSASRRVRLAEDWKTRSSQVAVGNMNEKPNTVD
jgi:hypothetical protein